MTLKQAGDCGAKVLKGEKSTIVAFWGRMYLDEKSKRNVTLKVKQMLENGGTVPEGVTVLYLLRYYNVFNL